MSARRRGRGRGFNRNKSFANADQPSIIPVEKITTTHTTPKYPAHDRCPAPLIHNADYDELNVIHNQLLSQFQSSNYYLKLEDENSRLFTSQGETPAPKKIALNFDWDYFPLELRPVGKRKLKDESEILLNLQRSKMASMDLSWLDKLEEREKNDVTLQDAVKEEPIEQIVKAEPELPDDEEVEEFDDEELDADTDYNTNYFDNGEGYLDEDDDMDEPCY